MITTIIFYAFSLVLIVAALGIVTSRNPVHSAMFLVLAFFNSAVLWLLMEAEFLAIILVLVYVGAVMVLFLFVVMMLDINFEKMREGMTRYAPLGIVIALVMVLEIAHVGGIKAEGFGRFTTPVPHAADYSNTKELGAVLYTDYVYPFELAAVLLLLAIVSAITLTMRRRPGVKVQDIRKQISVKREDRVRLVSMEAEKDS